MKKKQYVKPETEFVKIGLYDLLAGDGIRFATEEDLPPAAKWHPGDEYDSSGLFDDQVDDDAPKPKSLWDD